MSRVDKLMKLFKKLLKPIEKDLSKPQRTHYETYVMGMMLPNDKRRKSINAINELVGIKDQSSLNRFLNGSKGEVAKGNWNNELSNRLKNRKVALVLDDTILEHPYSEKMEGVGSFYDHSKKQSIDGHQVVTATLVDIETKEMHPLDITPYLKVENFLNGCNCKRCRQVQHRVSQLGVKPCRCKKCKIMDFQTKIQIAQRIILAAKTKFDVVFVLMDSWYASDDMLDTIGNITYVSELKNNRWVYKLEHSASGIRDVPEFPRIHTGSRYQKMARKLGWAKIKEIAEEALNDGRFIDRTDNHTENMLVNFTKEYPLNLAFTNGRILNIRMFYNPKDKEFKFLCSNKLDLASEDFITLWRMRWQIEEFHKDVKDLGLGEYQLRKLKTVLIHGHIAIVAYCLLKEFLANSVEFFGQVLHTIGECSRKIKELLFYRHTRINLWAG